MKPGDEAQKTTKPRSKSPGTWDADSTSESGRNSDEESEADSKEAATKRLHARMAALNSRFTAAKELDTTLEIINAVCAYLLTAEVLLGVRRRGRTDTQLNIEAGQPVVEVTALEVEPLAKLDLACDIRANRRLSAYVALVVATVSMIAAWTAVATYAATAEQHRLGAEDGFTYLGISYRGEIWTPIGAPGALASYRTLLAIVIPTARQAAVLHSSAGVSEEGLVTMAVFYPGIIALGCYMYASLLLDIPDKVLATGIGSSFALMVMTFLAVFASDIACGRDKLARLGEVHEQDSDEEK